MILHTINKSPFTHANLNNCLDFITAGDAILLLEDGVYAALNTPLTTAIITKHANITYHAIETDLQVRGIIDKIHSNIVVVSYNEFVDLCVKADKVVPWL